MSLTHDDKGFMMGIEYLFGNLTQFAEVTEKFLRELEKTKINEYDGFIDGQPTKIAMPELLNINVMNTYPHIYRSSLFINACSTFEAKLTELCNLVNLNKRLNQPFSSGQKTLSKANSYLRDIAHYNVPENEKIWNQITDLFKIRNCIVHDGGKISDEKRSDILRVAKQYPDISHSVMELYNELLIESGDLAFELTPLDEAEKNNVYFKKSFCFNCINLFEKYFHRLIELN